MPHNYKIAEKRTSLTSLDLRFFNLYWYEDNSSAPLLELVWDAREDLWMTRQVSSHGVPAAWRKLTP